MEPISSPPPPPPSTPAKIALSSDDKENISKEELLKRYDDLVSYVKFLEQQLVEPSKPLNEKLKLQQQESSRRENVLGIRLATKEQEMQDLVNQYQELKQSQTPSTAQLQTLLIDPAVNLLFEKMKTELTETKDKLEQAQNDLNAWKFTPDSVTGKKLMAKCRMLIQENQELGKQLSQGRIAQLEAELSLQKKYSEELKASQDEMNEFVIQLDEDMEGMQATICTLQQQLKDAKILNGKLEEEKVLLKNTDAKPTGVESLVEQGHVSLDERTAETTTINDDCETVKDFTECMEVDRTKVVDEPETIINGCDDLHLDENPHIDVPKNASDPDLSPPPPKDCQTSPRVTKCLTKTSFSITDLLATDTKLQNGRESETTVQLEEINGSINGDIDATAV